jgi:hypothetical protein
MHRSWARVAVHFVRCGYNTSPSVGGDSIDIKCMVGS